MTRGKLTAERRLIIDVHSARQSYRCFELFEVALVCEEDDVSNSLNNAKKNPKLKPLISLGVDGTQMQQWICREELEPSCLVIRTEG